MKIAIVSVGDDRVKIERTITWELWQKLADKYGYDTYFYEYNITPERLIGWSKIKIILKYIKDYDYILCVDYDAFPVKDFKIEDFIDNENELYIANDVNGINAGVFILKGGEKSETFLNKVWTTAPNNPLSEQGAMGILLKQRYSIKVKYMDRKIFNSYGYSGDESANFSRDTIIAHTAGYPAETGPDLTRKMQSAMPRWWAIQRMIDFSNGIWRE